MSAPGRHRRRGRVRWAAVRLFDAAQRVTGGNVLPIAIMVGLASMLALALVLLLAAPGPLTGLGVVACSGVLLLVFDVAEYPPAGTGPRRKG